jgi:hypothetical protein
MFRLLNKKIVGKIYFLLIWIMPVMYGGMIIFASFHKCIELTIDNDENESSEEPSSSPDLDDVEPLVSPLSLNFTKSHLLFQNSENTLSYFLLSAYNVCLEQKTPPP